MELWQNDIVSKTRSTGRKPLTGPLCSAQILHGPARYQTQLLAVTGRRLIAWVMACQKVLKILFVALRHNTNNNKIITMH